MGDRTQETMSAIADVNLMDKVQVEFAADSDLLLTTQCYCCMQSFYISFPGCCGGNREEECICCSSAAGGKCLRSRTEPRPGTPRSPWAAAWTTPRVTSSSRRLL